MAGTCRMLRARLEVVVTESLVHGGFDSTRGLVLIGVEAGPLIEGSPSRAAARAGRWA